MPFIETTLLLTAQDPEALEHDLNESIDLYQARGFNVDIQFSTASFGQFGARFSALLIVTDKTR